MGDSEIPIKEVHFVMQNEHIVVFTPLDDRWSQFEVSPGIELNADFLDEFHLLLRKYDLFEDGS